MASGRQGPVPDAADRAEDVGNSPDEVEQEGEHDADLPLTMAASVVLTSLPKDAHEALEAVAKESEGEKGQFRRWKFVHDTSD